MKPLDTTSAARLQTCHPFLVEVGLRVAEHVAFVVIEGAREEALQDSYYAQGRSKLRGSDPRAKHVVGRYRRLSDAVDVAPAPVQWPEELLPRLLSVELSSRVRRAAAAELGKRWARFARLAQIWIDEAARLAAERPEWAGLRLRWGGDWDGDYQLSDQKFDDLPHLEIA